MTPAVGSLEDYDSILLKDGTRFRYRGAAWRDARWAYRLAANRIWRTLYPIGRHRYFFELFALDLELPDLDRSTKAELEQAMKDHILVKMTLMGTYARER